MSLLLLVVLVLIVLLLLLMLMLLPMVWRRLLPYWPVSWHLPTVAIGHLVDGMICDLVTVVNITIKCYTISKSLSIETGARAR